MRKIGIKEKFKEGGYDDRVTAFCYFTGRQWKGVSAGILSSASPWQHIRPIEEDILAGEMILPGKHRIRSIDIGVLLSAGITDITVICKPTVAIFPTGSELIEPDEAPVEGSILESNSRMFEHGSGAGRIT